MISCFRHHDIRAKTRSRMTTATTFSRQRRWLTHVHHLELRTSRTRSRSSVLSCLGCEHPFVDKPIAITEPTVPRSWLLGLASELCQQRSYSILVESLPSTQKSGKRKKGNRLFRYKAVSRRTLQAVKLRKNLFHLEYSLRVNKTKNNILGESSTPPLSKLVSN